MGHDRTLDEAAAHGYHGAPNTALWSSPAFYAHELGTFFRNTGRPEPRDVRMGRGDSIRASDMRFTFQGNPVHGLTFERVE
jgi:hypothetical protein